MRLAYVAFENSGRKVTGTIEAADSVSATETLRNRGLYVTEIAEPTSGSAKPAGKSAAAFRRSRQLKNLAMFSRQLWVLVSSGTPLVQALGALERQTRDGLWRSAISDIRARVEEGASLSEAMEAHPEFFDPIYRSLIAAGESTGNLLPMLDRLAGLKQKQLRVRNSLIGAMIYPCLLVVIATIVLVLLLSFVVPRFAGLFKTLDVPLPASTQALVGVSELLRSYWWVVLLLVLGVVVCLKTWLGSPSGRRARDAAILRLPQVGNIVRSFAMARITRMLGSLLEGRVPVLEALRLTRQATTNVHYRELIAKAEQQVSRGETISSAFADTNLISPSVYEAIRNGENSGQIAPLLLNIAEFLDDENEVVVKSLTSIIEPVILVVLGLLVGLVALSMFMPLFDLTSMTRGGGI